MKTSRKVLFSLVPALVLLLGGEALSWFVGWPRPSVQKTFEHNEPYWITDPNKVDAAFPHREVGGSFTVSTDAQGLRAPLHSLEKAPGAFRILFLGCSTTFGWGVNDDASYPAQVERILHDHGLTDVEVINGGQPGYTSFQGLWFYRNHARRYDADLVFFGYVVQDARRAAYSDRSQAILQQDARFLKDHLLYRSRLYRGLRGIIDERRIATKERPEEGDQGTWRVPLDEYVANIRAFADLVRQDGHELVTFGFPLEREGYTRDHRRLLRIAAEELSLRNLDIQSDMERLSGQSTLYFPQDRGHANAEGNAVIAGRVAEFIEHSGVLPGTGGTP